MRPTTAAHGRVKPLAIVAAALVALPSLIWAQAGPNDEPATQPAQGAPAAGTEAPSAPAAGTEAPAASTAGDHAEAAPDNLRLRRLEQRVQALKERAWRAKARVAMLEEAVLGGGVGANTTIVHVDEMGSSYRLVQLVYNLDGTQIYARKDDSGTLDRDEEIQILAGPMSPGSHTVSVLAVYEGRGYGVFKYMNKYKFTVRSSHTFTASEGKTTRIEAVAFERGNVTTPIDQRPAIDFKISYGASTQDAVEKLQ